MTEDPSSHPVKFHAAVQIFYAFREQVQKNGWLFTPDQLDILYQTMPVGFSSDLNHVLTLDIWLAGGLADTWAGLWPWASAVPHSRAYARNVARHMGLRLPNRYPDGESLVRWVKVDLLAAWSPDRGTSLDGINDPATAAGLPVLTAIAFHTDLRRGMTQALVPDIYLSGLTHVVPDDAAERALCIHCDVVNGLSIFRPPIGLSGGYNVSIPTFKDID